MAASRVGNPPRTTAGAAASMILTGRPDTRLSAEAHERVHAAAMQLGYRPNNPVQLDAAARAEVEAFLEALDADDDVQNVYAALAD